MPFFQLVPNARSVIVSRKRPNTKNVQNSLKSLLRWFCNLILPANIITLIKEKLKIDTVSMWSFSEVCGWKSLITSKRLNQLRRKKLNKLRLKRASKLFIPCVLTTWHSSSWRSQSNRHGRTLNSNYKTETRCNGYRSTSIIRRYNNNCIKYNSKHETHFK